MLLAGKSVSIADLYDSMHLFHGYSDGGVLMKLNEALGFIEVHGDHAEITNPYFLITSHVAWMLIAVVLIIALFMAAKRSKLTEKGAPRGIRNFLEPILLFIRDDIVRPSINDPHHDHGDDHGDHGHGDHGHEKTHKLADKLLPYFISVFFFILMLNLIGLFPGAGGVTSSITITACLAGTVLLIYVLGGMFFTQKPPVLGFIVNLVPKCPLPLWPLLFVIELAGVVAKPFALCVRLFANMTAGGIVLLALVGLSAAASTDVLGIGIGTMPMLLAVAIYALKIFVSLIQAYIFTFLAAIFIGSYLVPEH